MTFGATIIVLVVILLAAAIRILREYERGVIFRLGRLIRAKGPGLIWLWPFIDRMVKISLRTVVMDVPPQDVITRDNVSVQVNAVIYFRVLNPEKAVIEVENKNYPFGGACNRYYNMRSAITLDTQNLNLVRAWQKLTFQDFASYKPVLAKAKKRVGINKSFLVHSLFPLYYNFFSKLDMEVVLAQQLEEDGIQRQGSAFCYPAGIAHGFFGDLLKKELEYPDFYPCKC